ncbi:MAG: FG-GAP repeat domain-containing protein, partial [Planctomycetaceae bacterium]
MGGGVAWLDLDHDGWQDLYFPNGAALDPASPKADLAVAGNRVFRNRRGQQFSDVSVLSAADDTSYGQGVAAADYDADGFVDLFISNYGSDVLYRNNGDGTWTNVTDSAGAGDPLWSTSAVWLDLNDDGFTDLYCTNYMDVTIANSEPCLYEGRPGYCGPGKFNGLRDSVWVSDGAGGFRDGVAELGLTAPPSKGLAICAADLDRDLRAEIYVANDMEANLLFTRTPPPGSSAGTTATWRELAGTAGAAVS